MLKLGFLLYVISLIYESCYSPMIVEAVFWKGELLLQPNSFLGHDVRGRCDCHGHRS